MFFSVGVGLSISASVSLQCFTAFELADRLLLGIVPRIQQTSNLIQSICVADKLLDAVSTKQSDAPVAHKLNDNPEATDNGVCGSQPPHSLNTTVRSVPRLAHNSIRASGAFRALDGQDLQGVTQCLYSVSLFVIPSTQAVCC